jgi:hypothetical protein
MKKSLCIIILWSLVLTQIMGQATTEMPSKPTHSISLGMGLSRTALKMEVISPLIFSGSGMPFHLTYRRESTVSKQYIQLLYQSPTLKSPFDFKMQALDAFFTYGYLRKVKSFSKANLSVGGELQMMGSLRTMPQVINNDQVTMLNSLNITSTVDYAIGKHGFEAQLSIAALGYNIRTKDNFKIGAFEKSFSAFINSESHFETLPKYLNTAFRLSYVPQSNAKHLRWRVDYWGNFQRYNQRQYLGILQNQITTSLTYQF